jgi:hypothetical protein
VLRTTRFEANIPGVATITRHQASTSTGIWQATLPAGANEVTDFKIVLDNYIDPNGVHVVSSVPEPDSLTLVGIGIAGLVGYGYRRRQAPSSAVS